MRSLAANANTEYIAMLMLRGNPACTSSAMLVAFSPRQCEMEELGWSPGVSSSQTLAFHICSVGIIAVSCTFSRADCVIRA